MVFPTNCLNALNVSSLWFSDKLFEFRLFLFHSRISILSASYPRRNIIFIYLRSTQSYQFRLVWSTKKYQFVCFWSTQKFQFRLFSVLWGISIWSISDRLRISILSVLVHSRISNSSVVSTQEYQFHLFQIYSDIS